MSLIRRPSSPKEYKGYVYIADVAPGNQISVMVLEPIVQPVNYEKVRQFGGRVSQDELIYQTTGYRVVKHFAGTQSRPRHLGKIPKRGRSAKEEYRCRHHGKTIRLGSRLRRNGYVLVSHGIPFQAAAHDEVTQGHGVEAAISLAGDAAFFFTGPLARLAETARGRKSILSRRRLLRRRNCRSPWNTQGMFALRKR